MLSTTKTFLSAAAIAAALAPAASADTTLVDAPGARNLAGAGGYLTWAAPTADGRYKLTVRAPDGTVTQPAIAAFDQAPRVSVGSGQGTGTSRPLLALYSRDGDIHQLNVRTGVEQRVSRLSTSADETLAAVNLGSYVLVRRTGSRKGLWTVTRSGKGRRLTRAVPTQIALAQTRVASVEGGKVVVRRLSGDGRALVAKGSLRGISGLWLTRYRVGFATYDPAKGTTLHASGRFAGSGGPYTFSMTTDPFQGTSQLHGIVTNGSEPTTYLDDEGVKRFDPRPFHGR